MKILPVILSGGTGTRLWPLSRSAFPKQLLPLLHNKSLLQETALRINTLDEIGKPLIIASVENRFNIAAQLLDENIESEIILEPEGKNTAPAIAIAALSNIQAGNDDILLILPADHYIEDNVAFAETISRGINAANAGKLVTFGIVPRHPETGYGYIECENTQDEVLIVKRFIEKPTFEKAHEYFKQSHFFWNSGIFMFKASAVLNEMKELCPDIVEACQSALMNKKADLDFIRLDPTAFSSCPSISIDYALMEKTKNIALVPFQSYWSDLGSWAALAEIAPKDENLNVMVGDVFSVDVQNSYLRSESRLLAAVGVKNIVAIETSDAVLIADKDKSQNVKLLVDQLKKASRSEADLHRLVHRPWGTYETLFHGSNFLVKQITVAPGCKLSLQMHHHRAEHWIVVEGTATVTCGERFFDLQTNESTFIPCQEKHRLENKTAAPLKIIEIQTGSILSEDDIVRFEDIYGR